MEVDISFGSWLSRRRKELDLTQEALAAEIHCSVFTIRKIESGERRPSRAVAELLAERLGISAGQRELFLQVARGLRPVERLAGLDLVAVDGMPGRARPGAPPVSAPAGTAEAPVEITVTAGGGSLPVPPTPLLGREAELAQLARMLGDSDCRLLTLVGPGGMGKTHLALRLACDMRGHFYEGACFVPYAPVSSGEFVVPALAAAAGCAFHGFEAPRTQLLHYLREKQMLLVLDNLEHLPAAPELVADVLQVAPGVKVLATSRERLSLRGEWLYEVAGLPVAEVDAATAREPGKGGGVCGAAELFVTSARRVRADFEPGPEDWPAIARICRAVDGMPLAIELAAGWVRLLSCWEIADAVESGLDLLTTRLRDVPERHRSLRAVFDHSWRLLSAEEQGVLARLSILRGRFHRAAAEAVAGASLVTLAALEDKSLLRRAGPGHFDLHPLIQQYAAAHLAVAPADQAATQDRHSRYYLTWLAGREAALKGPDQDTAAAAIDASIENVRGAWQWAVDHGLLDLLGTATPALYWYYEMRSLHQEGARLFERAVAGCRALGPLVPAQQAVLSYLLTYQGYFYFRYGHAMDQVDGLFNEAIDLARAAAAPVMLGEGLLWRGVFAYLRGDFATADASIPQALALAEARGDQWTAPICLVHDGYSKLIRGGQEAEAWRLIEDSLRRVRRLGERKGLLRVLTYLGAAAQQMGQNNEARRIAQEALSLAEEMQDDWATVQALDILALLAHAEGDYAGAEVYERRGIALCRKIGEVWSMAQMLVHLGDTLCACSECDEGALAYVEACQGAADARLDVLALNALVRLAGLWAAAGGETPRGQQALVAACLVLNHPNCAEEARQRARRLWTDATQGLPADVVESLRRRAAQVALPELLRAALAELGAD